jgi:hypothetical protein
MFGQYSDGLAVGYDNGYFFGSQNLTANTVPGPIQLGSRSDGATRTGRISEVVYVSTALLPAQQQALEGYLAWKWGLQASLPSSHPYRNSAPTIVSGGPIITINNPASGGATTNSFLTMRGTAVSPNQVISVRYQVNNNPVQIASTGNGWTNWSAFLTLCPGENTLNLFAQDVAGNTAASHLTINVTPPVLWNPTAIGTNLALWLDASNYQSITLTGGGVSQWSDLSGQGNNVTSAATSAQPAYVPGSPTSLACLSFNRSSSIMVASTHSLAVGTNACTIYSIASIAPGAEGWRYVLGYGSADVGLGRSLLEEGGSQAAELSTWGPNLSVGDNWVTQPSIVGAIFTSSVLYGNFNGCAFYSMSTSMNTPAGALLNIGSNPGGYEYWWGNIYEIVAANAALSTDDAQKLEGYLAWKWGLETNLATDHLYRIFPPRFTDELSLSANYKAGPGLTLQLTGDPGSVYVL